MNCLNCGAELNWRGRSDQRYCSSKCRAQATRKRKTALIQIDSMLIDASHLYITLKRTPESRTDEAMSKLKLLRDDIEQLLRMYDKETMIERAQKDELISRRK